MIFSYEFMRNAYLSGLLLALTIPFIGVFVVLRHNSMIGDALSHVSLVGIMLGFMFQTSPILMAALACIAASMGIDWIRRKLPQYHELAVAIVMSAGVGIAAILSSFAGNGANFNSFLFGSIIAVSKDEIVWMAVIMAITIAMFLRYYSELFYMVYDEEDARLSGVNTKKMNVLTMILTGLTISVASRVVGALVVSSMLVIPVTCSMQIAKSYKQTLLYTILFTTVFVLIGITLSYYMDVKPGGTIVLLAVGTLLVLLLAKRTRS